MSALSQLKKQSQMSTILQQVEKTTGVKSATKSYVDDRFWTLTVDAAGNGSAIIRFLPAPNGEASPFQKMQRYNFKYNNKWYIENSLYTLGKVDPCFSAWNNLKNSSNPEDKLRAQSINRSMEYYSNIYVVKDFGNPENDGKVFLFKYGPQIFKMIMSKISPEFEDETPVNIFDPWEGANFKLRASIGNTKKRTYEKSVFEGTSALADSDEEIESIWLKSFPLESLVAEDQFKSYEDLEKRLNFVLYGTSETNSVSPKAKQNLVEDSIDDDDVPSFPSPSRTPSVNVSRVVEESMYDDDDDVNYFASLVD